MNINEYRTADGHQYRPQNVTPKSDEQKQRCAQIVKSFRDVLSNSYQSKQQVNSEEVKQNQKSIHLYKKYVVGGASHA